MQIGGHDIGVCSWSLKPKDLGELVGHMKELGLGHVQLALRPLLFLDDKRKHQELGHLRNAGVTVTSGMIEFPGEDYASIEIIRRTGGYVPDDLWPTRKRLSEQAARLAHEMGVTMVSTHVGFVPHPGQPGYDEMVGRIGEVAASFKQHGVDLLMETGQERAEELLQFLADLRRRGAANVFVNFDPANMILYGAGDPIAAVRTLGPHVRHVHVKDGTASTAPGREWGAEVPFGTGQVDVKAFLSALKSVGYAGPLVIEREAGDDRMGDVKTAIRTLRQAAGA
jgi:sugar phosphate isomerase/epimerase